MKKLMILAMLVMGSMTAFAQVSKEEQELIDLSNQKWVWMAEKNADRLWTMRSSSTWVAAGASNRKWISFVVA